MRLPQILGAVCLTPACQKMGAEFAKSLSPNHASLDPCTDFEELVCGGWRDNHPLRHDQGRTGTLSVISELVEEQLRKILEGPYPGESSHSHFSPRNLEPPTISLDEQNFNKLQRAYNACIDEPAIDALGVKPIIDILDGLQPAFNQMAEGDLSGVGVYTKRNGIPWALSVATDVDPYNPTKKVISLGVRHTIGLGSKAYYFDLDTMIEYRSTLTHVLTHVHPTGADASRAAEWADSIVRFETKIAHIMPDISFFRQAGVTPLSTKGVDSYVPQLNISNIIKAFAPAGYNLEEERVYVTTTNFFAKFSALVRETDQQTLEWYFNWKTIQAWAGSVIADAVFNPYDALINKLAGVEADGRTPRHRKCQQHVTGLLGWILSRFFIENSFSAKDKDLGNAIIAEVKQLYVSNFRKHEWMDQSVKDMAVEKMNSMVRKIGYPERSPNITDPAALSAFYANLNITDEMVSNIRSYMAWSLDRVWSRLLEPVDRNEWSMYPLTVNAYYSSLGNEIVFPAAIMQPPIFSAELPSYVSYGSFGSVAGHEISHAFDDQGRKFDAKGHFSNWWTNSTLEEYQKKTQCFVDQYNSYSVVGAKGETVNIVGNQTLGENIADSGGLSVAHAAWKAKYLANSKEGTVDDPDNLLLPGLEKTVFDTPEKMFFLAYGNLWCSKANPAALTQQVLTDVHSPGDVRIKGTLENSRPFLKAFNCPVQEPRCELW